MLTQILALGTSPNGPRAGMAAELRRAVASSALDRSMSAPALEACNSPCGLKQHASPLPGTLRCGRCGSLALRHATTRHNSAAIPWTVPDHAHGSLPSELLWYCGYRLPEPIGSVMMRPGKAVKSARGGGLVPAVQATR